MTRFTKWRSKFGSMDATEAKRLKEPELENSKLKRLLAEAHFDIHALKSAFGTKTRHQALTDCAW
jgi:putative transposase